MFYIIPAMFVLILLLGITLYNILRGPELRNSPDLKSYPMVSVLIPARNEEKNIGRCLESLHSQDYPNFEIIVLDDQSEDNTASMIKFWQTKFPKLKLVHGKTLPAGWTGKNWACHQLSEVAQGDYSIFADADTRHHPDAIRDTIGWMQQYQTGVFSAFPQQVTQTFAEKLLVPLLDVILYASLPLWSIYSSRFPSMTAANGQWLAFRKKIYKKLGGHELVKNEVVEDLAIVRLAKRQRIRVLSTTGTDRIYTRMYRSFSEIWDGFSKNMYGIFSTKKVLFFSTLTGIFLLSVFPFGLLFLPEFQMFALFLIGLNFLIRFLLALKYKHSLLLSTFLHPVAMMLLLAMAVNSFYTVRTNQIVWKNRKVQYNLSG